VSGNNSYSSDEVRLGFWRWIFADAKFAELSVGLLGGPLWIRNRQSFDGSTVYDNKYKGSFFAVDISLLGKYPFSLASGSILLFPLLGIGYQAIASATLEDYDIDTPSDLSVFKLMVGIGSDFALGRTLYLRVSLLGYYRFADKYEKDFVESVDKLIGSSGKHEGGPGAVFKAGVGFKL
jgi:hypothetical protein